MFLDYYDKTKNFIWKVHIYSTEDKQSAKDLNTTIIESIKNGFIENDRVSNETFEKFLNEYPSTFEEIILYSLLFYNTRNKKLEEIDVTKVFPDYSKTNIYLDDLYSSSNLRGDTFGISIHALAPADISLPNQSDSGYTLYKNYYLLPIDLFSNGYTLPYFGNALVLEEISPYITDRARLDVKGTQLSYMYSSNISSRFTTKFDSSVCTGALRSRSVNSLCSLNIANSKSAYTHSTYGIFFLEFIRENIKFSLNLLKEYFGDTNENNEINEVPGVSTTSQCSSEPMETEVAQSNNPFERNISYEQRISGSYVEPSNEEAI